MNILPEQSHEENLISMLCDYYYWKTHPNESEDGQWHRSEEGEEFADRVMKFIEKELGEQ